MASLTRPPLSTFRRHTATTTLTPTRRLTIKAVRETILDGPEHLAAFKAVEYVSSGMVVGLGTGSAAAYVVDRIGQLLAWGDLTNIIGVATSKRTQEQAAALGIPLSTLDDHPKLDLTIDGADEVDDDLNLVQGRGGALLRQKMVATASRKLIVAVDDSKLVTGLGASGLAMPVEVEQFCWKYNLVRLKELFQDEGCDAKLRLNADGKPYVTENMNYIVDLFFESRILAPDYAGKQILEFEGVVAHGLFITSPNWSTTTTVISVGPRTGVNVRDK